jgi:hypothetical protein
MGKTWKDSQGSSKKFNKKFSDNESYDKKNSKKSKNRLDLRKGDSDDRY